MYPTDESPLSLPLGRMFPTRPTDYVHVVVSRGERGPFVMVNGEVVGAETSRRMAPVIASSRGLPAMVAVGRYRVGF
jgi:hypothetical protein